MKMFFLFLLAIFVGIQSAHAALKTKTIEYKSGADIMEGYLVYDDKFSGPRPGILVVHEWMGLNDYIKTRADMLAKLGYVAFAPDIYGKGIRPKSVEEASVESSKYKNNRGLYRERLKAGLDVLKAQNDVDAKRMAAIGFCFGGTGALELARSGAYVKGAVVFHGSLNSPTSQDARNIKAEVLVLNGAEDPLVPTAEVEEFKQEMQSAGIKHQVVLYPGAQHGFSNPANKGEVKGVQYNREADVQSWRALEDFLKRIF